MLFCTGLMGSKTLRSSGVNACVISRFVHSLVLTEGGDARGALYPSQRFHDSKRTDVASTMRSRQEIASLIAAIYGIGIGPGTTR